MIFKRKSIKLVLGCDYTIWYNPLKKMNCRLIQPTEKGYNFLNLDTNKCVLKYHLYKSKCSEHTENDKTVFWVNENLKISTIYRKEELLDAPKVLRTHYYCMNPADYDIECPLCGQHTMSWSEYEGHIWCYHCQKDILLTWKNSGVFSGPIPIGTAGLLGMSFDRVDMDENIIKFNPLGENSKKYNESWVKDKKLNEYEKELNEKYSN